MFKDRVLDAEVLLEFVKGKCPRGPPFVFRCLGFDDKIPLSQVDYKQQESVAYSSGD